MRSPLRAWREFTAEFTRVMAEHEEYLLSEFAPDPDDVTRARERRGRAGPEAPTDPGRP